MISNYDKNLEVVGYGEARTASFGTRAMRFLRHRILPSYIWFRLVRLRLVQYAKLIAPDKHIRCNALRLLTPYYAGCVINGLFCLSPRPSPRPGRQVIGLPPRRPLPVRPSCPPPAPCRRR